jgi:hypothetical protein
VLLLPRDADMVDLITQEVRKVSAAPMLTPDIVDG